MAYWSADGCELWTGPAIRTLSDRAKVPEKSVQTVVTSPPYWSLRDYGVEGQVGLEDSPEQHIEHLVRIFRAVRKVLRDDGTVWINYGDSYQDGQLTGMPWQLAFALRADGWYLRSAVVWAKGVSFCDEYSGSVMPESVNGWRYERCKVKVARKKNAGKQPTNAGSFTAQSGGTDKVEYKPCPGCEKCEDGHGPDGYVLRQGSWRPTSAHEYVFMLAKSDTYFMDAEAVREETSNNTYSKGDKLSPPKEGVEGHKDWHKYVSEKNVGAGRNPRDVWTIGTSGTSRAHYAAYPEELVEPCLQAATPKHACAECGAPWAPVVDTEYDVHRDSDIQEQPKQKGRDDSWGFSKGAVASKSNDIKGHRPTCTCDAGKARPVVLDPFSGTATTGVVAAKMGCKYIGIDLSEEYTEMAQNRLREVITGVPEDDPHQCALFEEGG